MNRVLQYIRQPECRCCVAKRQYDALKAVCEAIEADADRAIEFAVPSVGRLSGKFDDLDPDEGPADPPTVELFVRIEADRVPIDADLRRYAFEEMCRIAHELLDAAEHLEGQTEEPANGGAP